MPKKLILVLALIFFFKFNLARAGVIINEFVSRPNSSEPEWVELFNDSENSQDLNNWKLKELTSPDKNPVEIDWIALSGNLPAHGILVFEVMGANLNNEGDSISLYNGATFIDRVTYGTNSTVKNYSINLTAPAIGKSGALISHIWQTNQNYTKGEQNPIPPLSAPVGGTGLVSDNSSVNNSSSGAVAITETKNKIKEEPKIKTQIISPMFGLVGLPLSLNGATLGLSGEQLRFGKYFWNFGDGDSKEVNLTDSQLFTHTYFYPGEYVVSLDYFSNPYIYSNIPDASNQITVKITGADISISRVGAEKDFFVELSNNTDISADLSNWILASAGKSFTIPRNTILASKKKMIISSRITSFSIADKDTLKLMTPQREIVFDYSASIVPVIPAKIVAKNIVPVKLLVSEAKNISKNVTNGAIAENVAENLPALALNSDVAIQDEKSSYSFPIFPIASLFFIGASAGAVYFIRQKKVIPKAGNDFEILDE